jgi:hypothetical protein
MAEAAAHQQDAPHKVKALPGTASMAVLAAFQNSRRWGVDSAIQATIGHLTTRHDSPPAPHHKA